jgi:hypothetical protein
LIEEARELRGDGNIETEISGQKQQIAQMRLEREESRLKNKK